MNDSLSNSILLTLKNISVCTINKYKKKTEKCQVLKAEVCGGVLVQRMDGGVTMAEPTGGFFGRFAPSERRQSLRRGALRSDLKKIPVADIISLSGEGLDCDRRNVIGWR